MKFFSVVCVLATAPGLLLTTEAMPDIQVSLRGKKYDLTGVDTVQELQDQLSEQSGVAPSKQGRVLFNGKRLSSEDNLIEAGVKDGDQLNIVPKSKSSKSSTTKKQATATTAASASENPGASGMDDILKGLGGAGMDDLMKNFGGGEGGGAPDLKESMEMMSGMMNSPIFKEYMSDPARLEESRQMILNNPMLKSMMAGMPGMEELLNSPEAWREAMQAAAAMYENMDQNDLMQAMMGGAGAGGMPGGGMPGLFDGAASTKSNDMAVFCISCPSTQNSHDIIPSSFVLVQLVGIVKGGLDLAVRLLSFFVMSIDQFCHLGMITLSKAIGESIHVCPLSLRIIVNSTSTGNGNSLESCRSDPFHSILGDIGVIGSTTFAWRRRNHKPIDRIILAFHLDQYILVGTW